MMNLRPPILLLAASLLVPRPALAQEPPPKLAGVDVPVPKRTRSVAPQYPPDAQALGMRGIVILELLVGPDGKVVSARVTRSVPPFDEAALVAVRQWEYEVTKVDGQPVSVLLTVPIEFKMRLPELARDEGIPDLRQGVAPAFPAGAPAERATVTAEVTLDPDGHVAEAHIKSGESPWAEALFQALRTWRFTPLDGPDAMTFEVRAEFTGGKGNPRVDLYLTGPRRVEARAGASASPSPSPAPSPGASPDPSPAPVPSPSPMAAPPPAPPEELIENPAGGTPVSPPASLPPATAVPASPNPADPSATPALPAPAPPTPAPATPGISAVRDVTLAPGVPDLMRGRRPVAPPLARMHGISGTVEVHFAVDAAGSASVREVAGPEPLKEAARQTVASWSFRRSTPERLFLAATFTYKGDTAAAAVRPQE